MLLGSLQGEFRVLQLCVWCNCPQGKQWTDSQAPWGPQANPLEAFLQLGLRLTVITVVPLVWEGIDGLGGPAVHRSIQSPDPTNKPSAWYGIC